MQAGRGIFQSQQLTLRNMRLDALHYGVAADTRGNINVVAQGLDASGQGNGIGILLGGTNPTISNCNTSHRRSGVVLTLLNGGLISDLLARNTNVALHIGGNQNASSVPPTLSGIDARGASNALSLRWNGASWTLDNAVVDLDATDTDIGIAFYGSTNITLDGFVLPSRQAGIQGYGNGSPTNLTVRNTDVTSGAGLGVGTTSAAPITRSKASSPTTAPPRSSRQRHQPHRRRDHRAPRGQRGRPDQRRGQLDHVRPHHRRRRCRCQHR